MEKILRQPFALANRIAGHIAVHPADRKLDPPESYLYIQDGMVLIAAIFWVLTYFFYSLGCYRDKKSALPLQCLCSFLPWEIYYGIIMPNNAFEHISFLAMAAVDIFYCTVLVLHGSQGRRRQTAQTILLSTCLQLPLHWALNRYIVSDTDATALYTGLGCQICLSWISNWNVGFKGEIRGHSMEIWIVRFLGSIFALGGFLWRYLNVQQNWRYVGSWWSMAVHGIWLLGDLVYPFVYYRAKKRMMRKVKDL